MYFTGADPYLATQSGIYPLDSAINAGKFWPRLGNSEQNAYIIIVTLIVRMILV